MERTGSKPSILVLGATGDIGSTLLRRLTQAYHVRALTRKDPPTLTESFSKVEWVKGDVLDKESMYRAVEGIDTVLNTVGVMTAKHRNPQAYETNVTGVLNTVWACEEQGVRRFIHLSSVAVYGRQEEDTEEGRKLITEDNPLNAKGVYGLSKIEGEKVIQTVFKETKWTIIRPANLIGKEMDVFTGRIIKAIKEYPIDYFVGPEATFNYINVNNLVNLMVLTTYLPGARNQIFNAVDGAVSWENMIKQHAHSVGRKTQVITVPRWITKVLLASPSRDILERGLNVSVELLESQVSRRTYSAQKAKTVLDWNPRISLDDTMADISNYFRQT